MSDLRERTIGDYLDTLGSSSPTPGGGSVAGLAGALGASLGKMVIGLTVKREPSDAMDAEFAHLHSAVETLIDASRQDEEAYGGYIAASRLPKGTDEEKAHRRQAMQEALIHAAEVPLTLATASLGVLSSMAIVIERGSKHALSDAAIGVALAEVSVNGALTFVRANVPMIKDEAVASSLAQRADSIESVTQTMVSELRAAIAAR